MFRSHHITLILARERRLDLIRLGETASAPFGAEPQLERKMENRFVEPVEHADSQLGSPEPAPTPTPRKATIRAWRRAGEPRFPARAGATERPARELDRV